MASASGGVERPEFEEAPASLKCSTHVKHAAEPSTIVLAQSITNFCC